MSVTEAFILKDKPFCIVIFGVSGDLALRMLLPSLKTISCYEPLHPETKIIGVARSDVKDTLNAKIKDGINKYGRVPQDASQCETMDAFLKRVSYIRGEYKDIATYNTLKAEIEKTPFAGVLFYLSTPPVLFEIIAENLGKCGLSRHPKFWTRLVVEKPFGIDYESTIKLNNSLHKSFDEENIYRIDHYLAKETVMNIFTFRWGNTLWEPVWNRNFISHVEVFVGEKVDVGNRTGYYDESSVIRDMIQNHLMQILTIIAMEPPVVMDSKNIRDEKMKVLAAIGKMDIVDDVVLGQYYGYQEHKGIKPGSTTPTLAVFRFFINNWRWRGVPFYLISGKSLNEKKSVIRLTFKKVPHSFFGAQTIEHPNVLEIQVQPNEGIRLKQHVKIPGQGLKTRETSLLFQYKDEFGENALQGAYERVILDAIRGDQSFFPRSDEIEQAWKIMAPILLPSWNVVPYAPGLDLTHGYVMRNSTFPAEVTRFVSQGDFVNCTAETITRIISNAIEKRGKCFIALSGGSTPYPVLRQLSTTLHMSRIDAKKLFVFFVDERCVAPDHKDSNYKMINEAFLQDAKIPEANIFRMKGEIDPKQAAKEYTDILISQMGEKPVFDFILLGMGPDCHTASLFPGTAAVNDNESFVIGHFVPQQKSNRITLGKKVINDSRVCMFIINDPKKEEQFNKVRNGPYVPSLLPSQAIRPVDGKLLFNVNFG